MKLVEIANEFYNPNTIFKVTRITHYAEYCTFRIIFKGDESYIQFEEEDEDKAESIRTKIVLDIDAALK